MGTDTSLDPRDVRRLASAGVDLLMAAAVRVWAAGARFRAGRPASGRRGALAPTGIDAVIAGVEPDVQPGPEPARPEQAGDRREARPSRYRVLITTPRVSAKPGDVVLWPFERVRRWWTASLSSLSAGGVGVVHALLPSRPFWSRLGGLLSLAGQKDWMGLVQGGRRSREVGLTWWGGVLARIRFLEVGVALQLLEPLRMAQSSSQEGVVR
ncbi:hypothetical protein [Pseudonocardia sp. H11422]|uniref:hypothetical protein n=1 Tax=Pseudonocardia sp. H11422 TaxID=2835866 RepID=UPI001BDD12F6|nr:hypothetical protein [Pseudonocardia sp. H11422]